MPDPSHIELDLRSKSRDDLLKLKCQYEAEIASIRTQIDRARIEARERKVFASLTWWQKAHHALRIKGRQCQQVQNALGRLRQQRESKLEATFMRAAKQHLPPEQFDQILAAARDAVNG